MQLVRYDTCFFHDELAASVGRHSSPHGLIFGWFRAGHGLVCDRS